MRYETEEKRQARRRQLCDDAFSYAQEYMRVNWGPAPRLRIFAARYGRAFRSIGLSVLEALRADPRFIVTMEGKQGGYAVRLNATAVVPAQALETSKNDLEFYGRIAKVHEELKRLGLPLKGSTTAVKWKEMYGTDYPHPVLDIEDTLL